MQRGAPLQLSEAAIVEVVPVPPPWQRPFSVATPPARDAWCGPINELWLAITWAALQNRRLLEIGSVPLIIVNNEQQRASALLATLFSQLNSPGTQPNTRPTAFALPVSPVPTAWPKAKAANVAGVLWLDAERLYVQRGMEDQIIHCNGELEARLPSCGRIVRSKVENRLYFEQFFRFSQAAPTADEMTTLFSLNETAPDGAGTPLGAPVAILDVTTLQWQRSGEEIEVNPWLTGDCPSFREQDNDDDDDLYDDDDDDDWQDPDALPAQRHPNRAVTTADGRYVWWADGVLTLDRRRQLIVDRLTGAPCWRVNIPAVAAPSITLPTAKTRQQRVKQSCRAIALYAGRWLLLHDDGRVTSDTETILHIAGGGFTAAAFSPDATQLAVGRHDGLNVISLVDHTVTTVPLPPIRKPRSPR